MIAARALLATGVSWDYASCLRFVHQCCNRDSRQGREMAKKSSKKTSKRTAKRASRKKIAKKTPRRSATKRGVPAALKDFSYEQLESAMQSRRSERRAELVATINDLRKQLNDAERELGTLGGSPFPSRGKSKAASRPGRKTRAAGKRRPRGALTDAILTELKKGERTVSELIKACGKHSSSDNPRASVSVALNNLKKQGHVSNPSRGVWTASKSK